MPPVRCPGAPDWSWRCARPACSPLPVAAGAQAEPAQVRVAHSSPDAPAVDVNDDRVLSGVRYRTVSKYLELPAGSYDLAVRPAGRPPPPTR
jgi:hypothetical protein